MLTQHGAGDRTGHLLRRQVPPGVGPAVRDAQPMVEIAPMCKENREIVPHTRSPAESRPSKVMSNALGTGRSYSPKQALRRYRTWLFCGEVRSCVGARHRPAPPGRLSQRPGLDIHTVKDLAALAGLTGVRAADSGLLTALICERYGRPTYQ